ncbi:MAG TPA: DoxX family protein [Gammaproteobacteria bacterium]|nr:DoxX family protein [Gammaproteobacteria bacterium]
MKLALPPARIAFALVLIGLGITGLVNGGFALVWQYVPKGVPGYTALAYACGVLELLAGLGLLFRSTITFAARLSFALLLLWVILLKLPAFFTKPQLVETWGGFGEIGIILAGTWVLFATHAGAWERRYLKFAVGDTGVRWARALFILCLPMIGIVHLLESKGVADFVPAWLPFHYFLAYFTGSASFVAALALILGVCSRLAATLETVMLGIITVLCWGPILSTGRTACTAFLISSAITVGAWLVAETYGNRPWLGRRDFGPKTATE